VESRPSIETAAKLASPAQFETAASVEPGHVSEYPGTRWSEKPPSLASALVVDLNERTSRDDTKTVDAIVAQRVADRSSPIRHRSCAI